MADAALEIVFAEVTLALRPLVEAAEEQPPGEGLKRLALETGFDLEGALDSQTAEDFAAAVSEIYNVLLGLVTDPSGFATQIPDVIEQIAAFSDELDTLDELLPAGSDLAARLFDYLVARYLEQKSPSMYSLLVLFGVIRLTEVAATVELPAYMRREVVWDQFGKLTAPEQVFNDLYGWGDPALDSNTLLMRVSDVLWALGVPAGYEGPRSPGADGTMQLTWMLGAGPVSTQLGLEAGQAPAAGAAAPGIGLVPGGLVELEFDVPLSPDWTLTFEVSAEASSGYRVTIRPQAGVGLEPIPGQPAVDWTLGGAIVLTRAAPAGGRTILFGAPGATRLEAESVAVRAGVEASPDGGDAAVDLTVTRGQVVVQTQDGDSFLREILPPEGIALEFDFLLGWSTAKGLYFGGSAGLETTLPLDASLGPLRIKTVTLGFKGLDDGRLETTAAASGGLDLSVIAVSVDRVGLRATIDPSPPFGVEVGFRPPTGIGLAIDTPAVRAGGFLLIDTERGRYVGAVELSIVDTFDLAAIGLITTRMPDGTEGFSLLLILSATFPVPIPLGYNFYFAGAGGLLGLNRSVDLDRLRLGLRSGTADSILFPTDVVRRMDAIVRDVEEVFPVAQGQFLVGPIALITWSTPPLISVKLGLIVEIGTPVRIAILGVLRASLPEESDPIVDLKVAFLGAIDTQASLLSFDASIYDSYIGREDFKLSLEGDIALRVSWGPQPEFVTSVGGFHPLYRPAAHLKLPELRRLSLSLLKDNPRLQLTTYMAVTSNTAQFGAQLDFKLEVAGFSVVGEFGFDVLFQFSPFAFMAEVRARLAVMAGGSEVLTLSLEFALSGPTPWIARGRAKFKILFFSVTVEFEKRFGEEALTTLPDVAVLPAVTGELAREANWRGELGQGASTLVQLFPIEPAEGRVVIDAGGVVSVSQRVLPLETDFSLFGNARPSDAERVTVRGLRLAGAEAEVAPVTDMFAPAAFQELSDRDKLAAPPYEVRPAGVRATGGEELRTDYVLARPVQYELVVSDVAAGGEEERFGAQAEPRDAFEELVPGGAAGHSELSRKRRRADERGALRDAGEPRELFAVASRADLRPLTDEGLPAAPEGVDAAGRPVYAEGVVVPRTDAEARRSALLADGLADGRLEVVPEVQLVG